MVTALAKGGTIITAEAGGVSATCLVAVYIKAPKVVDLGLSVGWASCNVGATSPEEFGDHYAWGEVEPKEYYGWEWRMPTKEEMEELIANCYNQFVGFVSITTVSVGYSVRGVLP